MIFRYFSFEVCFVTIFKSDVTLMKYVIRVKPFDVLIKNGMANMTSAVCATRFVDEPQVRRLKGDTLLTKEPSTEEKLST